MTPRPDHVFATVDGDGAFDPPWQDNWDRFLEYWIYELKEEVYEPSRQYSAFAARMNAYMDWLGVFGEASFLGAPIVQRVEDFVACQHSRDTFAPSKLGSRSIEFEKQLAEILEPHAVNGLLSYSVKSNVVWGSIRPYPKSSTSRAARLS